MNVLTLDLTFHFLRHYLNLEATRLADKLFEGIGTELLVEGDGDELDGSEVFELDGTELLKIAHKINNGNRMQNKLHVLL